MLVSFITALAVKTSISQLTVGAGTYELARPLTEVPLLVWLTFFTSITFILRFFFGNIEYLNADIDNDTTELLLDSSTILIQSMLLALTTYYINKPELFFKYIILLLFVDCVWFFIFQIQAQAREKQKLNRSMGLGQLCSVVTIFLLVIFGYNYSPTAKELPLYKLLTDGTLNVGWVFGIIFFNLCFDLWLNGKRYLDIQSHCVVCEEQVH